MHISRLFSIGILALGLGAMPLAGCTNSTQTPAAVIAAAGALANGLAGAVTAIKVAYPNLIPPATMVEIQVDLALAQQASSQLSATLPSATGAATVQLVEANINAVLNLLSAPPLNGVIPPPFNEAIGAAAILVPVLEAFVTQYLPVPAAASPVRAALMQSVPGMTQGQAMAVIQGYAK